VNSGRILTMGRDLKNMPGIFICRAKKQKIIFFLVLLKKKVIIHFLII